MSTAAAPEPETQSGRLDRFDSSSDLMCVRDMQGRLVRVNRAWESTLGYSIDEVSTTPLLTLIHPADIPATRARMAEADNRNTIVDFVNRYRRRDGVHRFLRWRAQRLGDVILGSASDVTELLQQEVDLQAASSALDALLADISRRVRAPSGEILRTVRTLGRTRLTLAQRTLLKDLEHHVQALGDVASRLDEVERLGGAGAAVSRSMEQGRPAPVARVDLRLAPAVAGPPPRKAPDPGPPPSTDPAPLHAWIKDTLRDLGEHRELHNSLRDLPSLILGLMCVRLDHKGEFYPRRLLAQCAESGLMSVGRAAALLRRMQDMGFVDVAAQFQPGQIRPYRVLPAATRAFSGRLVVDLRSLSATDVEAGSALVAIAADPQKAVPLLAGLAEVVLQEWGKGPTPAGLLNGAFSMAKGRAIALSIGAEAIEEHGAVGEGRLEISLTSYAERFEVSRAHVRRVLKKLEACGLVRDPAHPSVLRVTRGFLDELNGCRAAEHRLLARVLERPGVSFTTPSRRDRHAG